MRNAQGVPQGKPKFSRLLWGAGGYVTSGSIADDGTAVTRTDEKAGYILLPGQDTWRELMRFGENIQQADLLFPSGFGNSQHCLEVAICATNSNVIYQIWHGRVWKTVNKTASWTVCNFPFTEALTTDLNLGTRRMGHRSMEVDPVNDNVMAFGHQLGGLYYTTDGGANFTRHPDIPVPSTISAIQIAFDRSSTVVGGRTQTVIVHVEGVGTYRSTTGIAGSFTLLTGSPTTDMQDILAVDGKVYCAGSAFWAYSGSAWTSVAQSFRTICRHPSNASIIYGFTSGGDLQISTNGGGAFAMLCASPTMTINSPDIPYLAKTRVFTADPLPALAKASEPAWMRYLPNGKLMLATGIGVIVFDTVPTVANQPLTGAFMSKGIENMVGAEMTLAPNGRLHATCHDRGYFSFDVSKVGRKQYPADNHPQGRFCHGHGVDWAIDDPNYVVAVYYGSTYVAITVSTDGGRTMNPAEGASPTLANGNVFSGGNVAVSNAGNFIWTPNSAGVHGRVAFTKDGGKTFGYSTFVGGDSQAPWMNAYTYARQALVADKSTPGTFYAYHNGLSYSDPNIGLWKSTDGGETFNKISTGIAAKTLGTNIGWGVDFYNAKLRLIPGKPGHMFWCPGGVGSTFDVPSAGLIYFSTDQFATVNITLPGWFEPDDVAIGANYSGASYPAIYIYGARSADMKARALYRCLDFNPATGNGTWELLEYNPGGTHSTLNIMVADPVEFGRVYFMVGGLSAYVGDYSNPATAT